MSFDWMESIVPPRQRVAWPEKRLQAIRREVQERAALLMRLGRSPEAAARRCRQNLMWDYELSGGAPLLDEVRELVNEVAQRTLTLDPRKT